MRRRSVGGTFSLAAVVVCALVYSRAFALYDQQARQQSPPPQATFRARVTLVPIDVRVLDRNGKPVTDLKQDDFTILEDGVAQQIRHFRREVLEPGQPGGDLALRAIPALELAPQNRRVFLIMLGRLWLPNVRFKGVEAITRFVRHQLLPQDYVAVSAWNRATEFTTDHERVAQVVERLQRYLDSMNTRAKALSLYNYAGRLIPPGVEAELDGVFQGPADSRVRTVPRAGQILSPQHLEEEIAAVKRSWSGDPVGSSYHVGSPSVRTDARMVGGWLQTLFSAIQYLRYVEGEKHVIYVTMSGLWLPSVEDDRSAAAVASDARVAIHVIQIGGVSNIGWAGVLTTKHLAELTGGQASITEYAERALTRIEQATRAGYLLGYYPSNSNFDGRYRKLTVKVHRPGVTVLCRHGYYAQEKPTPYDARQFVVHDRVMSAAEAEDQIRDIPITVKASIVKGMTISVEVLIDASRISLVDIDGLHLGTLDVAVFCADARENLVGEAWQKMDLRLKADTYQRLLKEGIAYKMEMPVKGMPRYVKVVVYDYRGDLTGSAVSRVR